MTEEKRANPSELIIVTDALAMAYTELGVTRATIENSKELFKDVNNELKTIKEKLGSQGTEIVWIKWILMIGLTTGVPLLVSILLKVLAH